VMSLATVETDPIGTDPIEQFMALLEPFFAAIDAVDERHALMALERGRRRFEAKRTALISHRTAPEASQLLRQAGASKRDAKRTVERGKLLNLRPELGASFERGDVSAEKLDVIATADRATRGAASSDPDFVRDIVEASPDAIHKKKNTWINNQQTADEVRRKYKFQRDNREVFKHWLDDGRPVLSIADDEANLEKLWGAFCAEADREYRNAGGRDVPTAEHDKTWKQRMADAAMRVLQGRGSASGKTAVVITVNADRLTTPDGMPLGEVVGTGPVPGDVILDALKNDAELWTLVSDSQEQPLWLGRSKRLATPAQLIALIARDKGCIETGRDWRDCHAHHDIPFESSARGDTDITNLTLLATDLHTQSHAEEFTWTFNPGTGRKERRPYKPEERVASRPRPQTCGTKDPP